jgi:hypothetical protein
MAKDRMPSKGATKALETSLTKRKVIPMNHEIIVLIKKEAAPQAGDRQRSTFPKPANHVVSERTA